MRILAPLFAIVFMVPLPGLAQTQLERMEVLSEQANALMNEAMVLQAPQLEGRLPSPEWDEPMRASFACVLEGYRADAGDAAVTRMLDQMAATMENATAEQMLSGELTQQVDLPDGVTPDRGTDLMNSCGVMELFMARMAASGIFDAAAE